MKHQYHARRCGMAAVLIASLVAFAASAACSGGSPDETSPACVDLNCPDSVPHYGVERTGMREVAHHACAANHDMSTNR